MKFEDIDAYVWAQADAAAREWFKLAAPLGGHGEFYLYYNETTGELGINRDDAGWILGDPRRISPANDLRTATRWIHDIARRLPIIIEA
jgi:hypothetical protein